MSSLLDVLDGVIDDRTIQHLGARIGASPETTSQAVASALPMLVAALSRAADSPGQAPSLLAALDRDGDGTVIDDLAGLLFAGAPRQSAPIVGELFGGARPQLEAALGRSTGLANTQVGALFEMLAPLVVGALGRARRERGPEAGSLGELLRADRERADAAAPDAVAMLTRALDANRDGSAVDDVMRIGGGLLASLFGRRV